MYVYKQACVVLLVVDLEIHHKHINYTVFCTTTLIMLQCMFNIVTLITLLHYCNTIILYVYVCEVTFTYYCYVISLFIGI